MTGSGAAEAGNAGDTDVRVGDVAPTDPRWADFVRSDPRSTFAHLGGWGEIMTDVLGHGCEYLAAMDRSGSWRGVLPLVRVRGILGHFLVSMPFLNDGGPLGDPSARAALCKEAIGRAQSSGAKVLELRARDAMPELATSHRKVGVHLALPETVDELWTKTFKAKLRSQIRRPSREGMTARTGGSELDAFYHVFGRNMRDLGTPVLPREFFVRLQGAFGDGVRFSAVYTAEGTPAAAACSLVWQDEVEVTWASSLRELNRFSPNMLLYAHLMETAIEAGQRTFNFGRSTPGAPTHRFKQQWGGNDVSLPWGLWSRAGATGTPSPDRPIFRLATAIWSRLPVGVTNRLGPALARQIP